MASVPPFLLRSAFGHDGLWVFANRILTDWSRQRERCILARQVGLSSAQHDEQPSRAQHGEERSDAQHGEECRGYQYYDLHHAIPLFAEAFGRATEDAPFRP